jgi:integrase/recombinase XerD
MRVLKSAGHDLLLNQITPKQIASYLDGSRMSAYTWWREYQIIRAFFKFWVSRNKLVRAPMPRPQAALPPPFRPHIFSRTELIRLLLAIERTRGLETLTIRTFLLFVYGTGALVHEAINLRVSDIDLSNCLVGFRSPDGARRRMLPIGRTMRNLLDVYIRFNSEQRQNGNDLAFLSRKGTRLRRGALCYNFRKICSRARIHQEHGISRTPGLHDLRHTFAVHCLEAWVREGKDLRQKLPLLAGYMGHKMLRSTELYLRLVPGRFVGQLARLRPRTGVKRLTDQIQ